MRKPFLIGYKRHNPRVSNFKFLSFSVYITLLEPKQPISIKKLRTLTRFTKPESDFRFVQFFFIHPVERLFSSVGRIFQPERATLTDNNFEKRKINYCVM